MPYSKYPDGGKDTSASVMLNQPLPPVYGGQWVAISTHRNNACGYAPRLYSILPHSVCACYNALLDAYKYIG